MDNLNKLIDKFQGTSIAVIGDIGLDMYYFLTDEKSEISLETGISTNSVTQFKHEAGGAGNVAINLKTLGASRVDIYGVLGIDPFGHSLKSILKKAGVNCNHIQTQEADWNTHVYHKVYKNGLEEPRYDIGNFNQVKPLIVEALLKDLESNLKNYNAVIINEQIIHGYHNEVFQQGLSSLIEKYEKECLWITDCRHLNDVYNRSIRKLNIQEARSLFTGINKKGKTLPDNKGIAKWLNSHWNKAVVVTLGEEGAIAVDHNGEIQEVAGINLVGQKDTVGAGDAFLAGLTLTLASGSSMKEALKIGNFSASVSVTKLHETGHPSVNEVLKMGASPDYRYMPELAKDARKARYFENTAIEIIIPKKAGFPRVAIFDHDGTISTLRQGWDPIMKELCIKAILGNSLSTVSMEKLKKIEVAAVEMIEKTTGIQTIIQMHHLMDMVRSFGFVPEGQILTPLEYKQIYNKKLIKMVDERINLFKKGQLNLSDLSIKGSIQFLEFLKNNNVKMYLASGTDQEDVRREAKILGYSDYFDGGIFGSIGDINSDPKKIVIETIVKELPKTIKPEECYVFGDGPVEMRESAKRGFTGIGLVSDEKRRFGINPEKRSRLILGGAQILIPDFSWIPSLSEYLGWGK
ncbi:MAG: PfkB family carbohydrate kinase [Spirochaetia bacterium]|jgi:rfaE bifunctional protein kinase chain/domain|nr:PfkB family carbohydrate kinase [Spirochaetia bacterium]